MYTKIGTDKLNKAFLQ